ncbi:hypothetical protein I7I48_03120 [Histoplasma ohiense]|nr:hypothetical protein I7I48_03120 [Histoplasma ohiense (nom. inval.)]
MTVLRNNFLRILHLQHHAPCSPLNPITANHSVNHHTIQASPPENAKHTRVWPSTCSTRITRLLNCTVPSRNQRAHHLQQRLAVGTTPLEVPMRHRPGPPAIQRPKPLRGTQYLKLLMPAVAARIPDLDPIVHVHFCKAGVHELHRAQIIGTHPDAGAHGIELRHGLVDRVFSRGILLAEADGEREARDACPDNGDGEGRVRRRRHGHVHRWS